MYFSNGFTSYLIFQATNNELSLILLVSIGFQISPNTYLDCPEQYTFEEQRSLKKSASLANNLKSGGNYAFDNFDYEAPMVGLV